MFHINLYSKSYFLSTSSSSAQHGVVTNTFHTKFLQTSFCWVHTLCSLFLIFLNRFVCCLYFILPLLVHLIVPLFYVMQATFEKNLLAMKLVEDISQYYLQSCLWVFMDGFRDNASVLDRKVQELDKLCQQDPMYDYQAEV